MKENSGFDFNQAYAAIKEQAEAEGITTKDGYDTIVEDYINASLGDGVLSVDEDSEAIIEELRSMWPEYEKNINIH